MKRLSSILLFAVLAACTKFDCPSVTPAQQRVLNYVSNSHFFRDNETGRVTLNFYEAEKTLRPERLFNGSEVLCHGEYNTIYYDHWPTFYCYRVSKNGKYLYSASFMGSGRFDTISINIPNDSTLVFGGYSYIMK